MHCFGSSAPKVEYTVCSTQSPTLDQVNQITRECTALVHAHLLGRKAPEDQSPGGPERPGSLVMEVCPLLVLLQQMFRL